MLLRARVKLLHSAQEFTHNACLIMNVIISNFIQWKRFYYITSLRTNQIGCNLNRNGKQSALGIINSFGVPVWLLGAFSSFARYDHYTPTLNLPKYQYIPSPMHLTQLANGFSACQATRQLLVKLKSDGCCRLCNQIPVVLACLRSAWQWVQH